MDAESGNSELGKVLDPRYARLGEALGLDLVNNAQWLASDLAGDQPGIVFDTACRQMLIAARGEIERALVPDTAKDVAVDVTTAVPGDSRR